MSERLINYHKLPLKLLHVHYRHVHFGDSDMNTRLCSRSICTCIYVDRGVNQLKWGVRVSTGVQLLIHSCPRGTSKLTSCPFHSIPYYFQVNTTASSYLMLGSIDCITLLFMIAVMVLYT